MAEAAIIIAAIGTAASVFGAIKANKQAKKQRALLSQQNVLLKEQEKTKRRAGFMEMLNEKRKAQRQSYILRAKVQAQDAGGAGVAESGQLGSIGSMSSQFAQRLGGLQTQNQMQADMSQRNEQIGDIGTGIAQSQSRQSGWMSFSTMGANIAGNAGQYGNLFKSPDVTSTKNSGSSGRFNQMNSSGTGRGYNANSIQMW
jgi:hypothetical protein